MFLCARKALATEPVPRRARLMAGKRYVYDTIFCMQNLYFRVTSESFINFAPFKCVKYNIFNIRHYFLLQDVQKHSVHTLVFRSLKRTHDMFVSDHAKTIAQDDER